MSANFCQFLTPFPPLSTFCLTSPLPVRTDTELEEKQRATKIMEEDSLKRTCTLYLFLACLFICQRLTQEANDEMTFKCPLLSYSDHTEKDIHLQLNLISLCPLLSSLLLTPSLSQGADILHRCPLYPIS